MTHEGARGLEVDPFSVACQEALFLGARLGYNGNFDAVGLFFKAHGADARSEDLFVLYDWVASEADRARRTADSQVSDSLREAIYDAVPDNPQECKYSFAPQGRRPASLLLAGLSFDSSGYHGTRPISSGAEVISAFRVPYPMSRAIHSRTPFPLRAGRVPVFSSRRLIFAGSS